MINRFSDIKFMINDERRQILLIRHHHMALVERHGTFFIKTWSSSNTNTDLLITPSISVSELYSELYDLASHFVNYGNMAEYVFFASYICGVASLLTRSSRLFASGEGSDITIIIHEQTYPQGKEIKEDHQIEQKKQPEIILKLHKSVLSQSEYFRQRFGAVKDVG